VPRVRTVPAILGGPADVDPLIGSGNPKGPLKDVRISICIYIYSIYIQYVYTHDIYIQYIYTHMSIYDYICIYLLVNMYNLKDLGHLGYK
jgi:hypothetical protein